MEAVHVFGGKHRFKHRLIVNVVGEGELDNEPVDVRIVVEVMHHLEQCILCDVQRFLHQGALEAHSGAGLHFVADIGPTGGVVTHQHRGEVWSLHAFGDSVLNRFCELSFDGQ